MSGQENETTSPDDDLGFFRGLVVNKIETEENLIASLEKGMANWKFGALIVVVLLAICIGAFFYVDHAFYFWLLISFFFLSFIWLILFLPTTRKDESYRSTVLVHSDTETTAKQSWKYIAKERKRLISEVWVNAFFFGNAVPTFAFIAIFGLSMFFALYFGYVENVISVANAWIIVGQCLAIIAFHAFLYITKPYIKSTFNLPKDFKQKISQAQRVNTLAIAGAYVFIILFIAGFSFLIVLGMLMPGTTYDKVKEFVAENGGANILGIIILAAIQYAVLRYFQSTNSTRMAHEVAVKQLQRLKEDVLPPLDAVIVEAKAGRPIDVEKLNDVKAEFYQICIYRIDRFDYFGRIPMYLINPDMKLLRREDVLELLDKAGGTASW